VEQQRKNLNENGGGFCCHSGHFQLSAFPSFLEATTL
jgi:hypothetical protein